MAIESGQETLTVTTIKRTFRVNLETPRGGDPMISIFREVWRLLADGTVLQQSQNFNPITVAAKDLADLAPYCQLTDEARALLQDPDEETLKKYLAIMPLITSIACDAAERREEARQAQQAQADQPTNLAPDPSGTQPPAA